MHHSITRLKKSELLTITTLIVVVTLLVLFDVSFSRQIICFLFLTIAPGLITIRLLGLRELDLHETVLFSVGFGLAFLMATGLLVSQASLILSFAEPLSTLPLLMILVTFVLIGAILVSSKMSNTERWNIRNLVHPTTIIFAWIPILTVLGAYLSNTFDNNQITLLVNLAIPVLFAIAVTSKKIAPNRLYPLIIFVIALSLLYRSSLMSNYLVSFGSDSHLEYFAFRTTETKAFWGTENPYFWDEAYGRLNSMLSITILPTIFTKFLNIDPTWVFKIIYPLIFSLVPVGLFQLWKKYFGERLAFLSAFLFMSEATFYNEMLGLNRQIVSEIFFVLLLFTIFDDKMRTLARMICFAILSMGLIVSHYGMAEIFLFFIISTYVFFRVRGKTSRRITTTMVVFFVVAMFSWYLYTSRAAAFDSMLGYGNYVLSQVGEFFNPASRGDVVLKGLGFGSAPSIWNTVHRVFVYSIEVLIVVGSLGLVTGLARKRANIKMDQEYYVLTVFAVILLGVCIIVPGFAATLNITRFYHILLFLLAPMFALGAALIASYCKKKIGRAHV